MNSTYRQKCYSNILGQKIWLAALNSKLSLRYVRAHEVDLVLSPKALILMLPSTLRMHPTFHVSQVKPVHSSLLRF